MLRWPSSTAGYTSSEDAGVLTIDSRSGKTAVAAALPVALTDPAATAVGRRIVVAGGGTDAVYSLAPKR